MKKLYPLIVLITFVAAQRGSAVTWNIGVQNFMFTNTPATVNVGDTVTWNWVDGSHTTTSTAVPAGAASWNEPINSGSASYSYVIATPGTYAFKCSIHGSMTGSFVAELATRIVSPIVSIADPVVSCSAFDLTVCFKLRDHDAVALTLADMAGKIVFATPSTKHAAGTHSTIISTAHLPKGIYILALSLGDRRVARKVNIQ